MTKKLALVLAASLLTVCNRGPAKTTVAFCFQDLETEFWIAAHQAITSTLAEKDIKVIERNANGDANKQLEQVRDLITQGVDGIVLIPQDGVSAVAIVGECNRAGIPIGVFNRPPAENTNAALVVVADNEKITEATVEYMVQQAQQRGGKAHPAIVVGDLDDPNAVYRRKGFYNAVNKNPDLFEKPVEIPSKWDTNTALSNIRSAFEAHPEIDFLFTSSDFLYPQIKAVLAPLGKWVPAGQEEHVILGGLDGDATACRLMEEGIVDATGVQDLYAEADTLLTALVDAIEKGEKTPAQWMEDPGFALTQANMDERKMDMWGCRLLAEKRAQSQQSATVAED